MNSPTLQGAAALVFGAVVFVWVYLIRTNMIRWYRWPLAAIAVVAGYVLVCLNARIVSQARMSADRVSWWENTSLTIVTVLFFVVLAMHWLHERHQRNERSGSLTTLKRSHAHARTQR